MPAKSDFPGKAKYSSSAAQSDLRVLASLYTQGYFQNGWCSTKLMIMLDGWRPTLGAFSDFDGELNSTGTENTQFADPMRIAQLMLDSRVPFVVDQHRGFRPP